MSEVIINPKKEEKGMINIEGFIKILRKQGFVLRGVNKKLQCVGPKEKPLSNEQRQFIKDNKNKILEFIEFEKKQKNIIPKVPISETIPLSFCQQRLWFLDQTIDKDTSAYNLFFTVKLKGELNEKAMLSSIQQLLARHDSLRTYFGHDDSGIPYQKVLPSLSLNILTRVKSDKLDEQLNKLINQPFNLSRPPLIRVKLFKLTNTEYVFALVKHHIISDGVSVAIFLDELKQLYQSYLLNNEVKLSELPLSYADYANWQHSEAYQQRISKQLDYWKQQLAGYEDLDLPTDFQRPAKQSFSGDILDFSISKEISERLLILAKQNNTTIFNVLQAAFSILLSQYSQQTDILISTPIANRPLESLSSIIGFFANTLVLRNQIDSSITFKQFLKQVSSNNLHAFENQEAPLEKIIEILEVERDLSRNPLFQVMFSLQNFFSQQESKFGNMVVEPLHVDSKIAKLDLTLFVAETDSGLQARFEYNTSLFKHSTIKKMADRFQGLLSIITNTSDSLLKDINLLTEEDAQQLEVWKYSDFQASNLKTLAEKFVEQVKNTPYSTAVISEDQQLTYAELDKRSNQLVNYLIEHYQEYYKAKVKANDIFAFCFENRLLMLISLLAISKIGATYLPLEPDYGKDRLQFVLEDSQTKFVLTEQSLVNLFECSKIICLDESIVENKINELSIDFILSKQSLNNLAYVIYTSGSTGKPKGVMVSQENVANYLEWFLGYSKMNNNSVVDCSSAISFDLTVSTIWGALLSGAKLILCSPELKKDAQRFVNHLNQHKINFLKVTPSYLAVLLTENSILQQPKTIILGGEALSIDLAKSWLARNQDDILINEYGPTETTVGISQYTITKANIHDLEVMSIGKPGAGNCFYILDKNLKPTPVGMPGELYVSGPSVTKGYLNRQKITDEAFIANPFEQGTQLYKTGDRVHWLPTGDLNYLGRIDNQVKIRGFRIEPDEITAAILQHEDVTQATVLVFNEKVRAQLLAFYVSKNKAIDLSNYLADKLPSYMQPTQFVAVDQLPLTLNGKIDHRLLLNNWHHQQSKMSISRAVTKLEKQLINIWQELLNITDDISIDENFFSLGGNSLLAIQALSRLRKLLNVSLSPRIIFEYPNIRSLAAYLEKDVNTPANTIPSLLSVKRPKQLPLSYAQQRLWFLDRYEEGKTATYNMPFALRIKGSLNINALRECFNVLVKRHEILRTIFSETAQGPIQIILPSLSIDIPVIALNEEQLRERLATESKHLFDLEKAPLLIVKVFKITEEDYVLFINQHHIISDGLSLMKLITELSATYQAYNHGKMPDLKPLNIQYADYSVWQRTCLEESEQLANEKAYWLKQLQGCETLNLTTDYPRPVVKSYAGAYLSFTIPDKLVSAIKDVKESTKTTSFMFFMACLSLLLNRYTQQDDIVIGSPVANRIDEALEDVLGIFVNTLAFRTKLSANQSFADLLESVKQCCLEAYANQALPFEELLDLLNLDRSLNHDPVFQVMLVLQDETQQQAPDFSGLSVESIPLETHTAKFDLSLYVTETNEGFQCSFEYNSDLFKLETIKRLSQHYINLLAAVVKTPSGQLNKIYILDNKEQYQVIEQWNQTTTPFPQEATIHGLFHSQALLTPDAIAIQFKQESLTYKQLDKKSTQLAFYLRQHSTEKLIAVCLERGVEMLIGLLAVLKAGAAYVPLDPSYPDKRLAYMLEDTKTSLVLSTSQLKAKLNKLCEHQQIVYLDEIADELATYPEIGEVVKTNPSDLMYVMYTSGSTGKPKGVMLEHQGLVNRLYWMQDQYSLSANDVVLQKTPYSFDVSVWELFWPVLVGAKVCFAEPDLHADPIYLQQLIYQEKVTTLHFVPSILKLFINELQQHDDANLASLRQVFCSGEGLPMSLVKEFKCYLPNVELHNLYGPTEASIDISYWDCNQSSTTTVAPIGKPIFNTKLYILDKNLQPVPIGVPGELYASGICLARGYLNRSELTAERFIKNPFVNLDKAENHYFNRLYKTGDLTRWMPDGNIEYLGRIDNQVKLNGVRIELDEIAAVLESYPLVSQAIVTIKGETTKKLVAYCILNKNKPEDFDLEKLRDFAKEQLPLSMIPNFYMVIDEIPLNANGKADIKKLPDPEIEQEQINTEFIPPVTENEITLTGIWADLLNLDKVGIHDNFFSLGGDSIMSIQMISRARAAGLLLTPKQLFAQPTIIELAKLANKVTVQQTNQIIPEVNYLSILEQAGYVINELCAAYPLSPLQAGLLFHALYAPESNQYSSQLTWHYHGDLELIRLKKAWELLMQQHEVLRCAFAWKNIETPLMFVAKKVKLEWQQHDWSSFSESEQKKKLKQYQDNDLQQGFDIQKPGLMRIHLIKFTDDHYCCIWNYHHILLDGWSLPVLLEELDSIYNNRIDSKLPKAANYSSYVNWLTQQDQTVAKTFWQKQLAGIETATDLGINKKALAIHKPINVVEEISYYVSTEQTVQIKQFAKKNQVTLNAVIQLAWAIVLSKYSSQDSVVFGTTVSGRSGEIADIERMVGLFINTLPVRVNLNQELTVIDQLRSLHQTIQEMNSYSYLGLNTIQQQSDITPEQPLFYSLFAFESYPDAGNETQSDLQMQDFSAAGKTNYPFVLHVEPGETIELRAAFDQECFSNESMNRLLNHVANVLMTIIKKPQTSLHDIDFLMAEEYQLIDEYNSTQEKLTGFTYLHEGFEQQVQQTPEKIALITADKEVSYGELNQMADKVAAQLIKQHVKTNQLVAVAVEKGWEQVVAVLGILKAGAAYLPLSINEAAVRLTQVLEQAEAEIVLTNDNCYEKLTYLDSVKLLSVNNLIKMKSSNYQPLMTKPTDLAYVIFTSGSTGKPKGVMTTHEAAVNTLLDINKRFDINETDRVLAISALNFDLSVYDIFGVLAAGASIVMPAEENCTKPKALLQLVADYHVTLWNSVPALMQLLVDQAVSSPAMLHSLRLVLLSGDWIPLQLPEQIWKYAGEDTEVISLGGATEGAIWSILYPIKKVSAEWKSIPYGRPMANQKFYVLDENLQQVPIGVTAELCIAGKGVAAGYWKDEQKTAAQFVHLSNGERVYRTGDLGRLNENGLIEFIGRKDTQVKVRGFRVELGEIEAVLAEYEPIEQAVVLLEKGQLFAFYKIQNEISEQSLRDYLNQHLPTYMLPTLLIPVKELPLTVNGKIDRKQLLKLVNDHQPEVTRVMPRDQLEASLQNIWQTLFALDSIGMHDRFSDLGGHSLLAIQLISRLNEHFDCDLPVSWIFANDNIAQQATQLRQQVESKKSLIYTFNKGKDETPLFLIHPGGGGSEAYVALATKLDKEQAVYGIDPYNLNTDNECITDIKQLASLYINEMRSVKPFGPYFLGGWSLGGLIAFEMALQLQAAGDEVLGLYLLDACLFDETIKADFKAIPWKNVFSVLEEKDDYYRSLPKQYQERYLRAFKAENDAIVGYQASGYVDNALLIKAAKQPVKQASLFYQIPEYFDLWCSLVNEKSNGWQNVINHLITIPVEEVHHNLLEGRNVDFIAKAIQSDISKKLMELVNAG